MASSYLEVFNPDGLTAASLFLVHPAPGLAQSLDMICPGALIAALVHTLWFLSQRPFFSSGLD